MPSVELKFVPVGYVNPKSQRGKPGRFALDDPLSFSSYERNGKFYVVFSMTKLGTWQGTPKLSTEIFNQDNTLVYTGERFFNQAGFDFYSKDRVDISSGIFLKAGEVLDTVEFEPGISTKALHGTAVVVANGIEISNVASFSMGSGLEVTTDLSTTPGYRTNTLKYGYEEPEPQVEKDCPMYCDIVYVPTNTVAYSGLCSCSMLENYQSDPDYRIDQISKRETKPDYRGTQPEPEKLYTVYGQTLPLSQSAVDYYESLGVSVTSAEIDPYVPPTEKPFEKPPRVSVFQPAEPEITTDHIEPPAEEEPEIITSQVEPSDLIDTIDTIETSQVEPPGVEVTEPITSQVEPPGQEVTAQISWFGNTWFPWHLELEDKRRR